MILTSLAGSAASLASSAVDAYRTRLDAHVEQRRLDGLQLNMLVSAGLAGIGMVVEAVGMQLRVNSLQHAVEEAAAAGDLHTAERLRGQLVESLEATPASAQLLNTLGEHISAILDRQANNDAPVIEGEAYEQS